MTSKLYNGIINATEQIVAKYGKGVITEERFVNILADIYPDRDNPAVFRIIKSTIKEGITKELASSKIQAIEYVVANNSSLLSKKYGYDNLLVEGILYSLSIGYGVISRSEYVTLSNKNNSPSKKQRRQNQNKQNPSPNSPNPPKSKSIDWIGVKFVFILLWGMLGLLISPFVYLYVICKNDGLCLVGSFAIACIHLFTLIPLTASIDNYVLSGNKKTYPTIAGAASSLILCAGLYWVAFPIFFGFDTVLSYWGLSCKDSFPWLPTIVANLFCAAVLIACLTHIEDFSGIIIQTNKSNAFLKQGLFMSKPYKNGFLAVLGFYILIGLLVFITPPIENALSKYKIEGLNKQIDQINQQKDSLKSERCKNSRNLSFAQFILGDSYKATLSKINKTDEYSVSTVSSGDELYISDQNYISIVDSIIHLKTDWNNEKVSIELFFSCQQLIALRFSPRKTDGDSILSIYTAKYGDPEYHLSKYVYAKDCGLENNYENDYKLSLGNEMMDQLYPTSYYWTYKNTLLKIDYDKNRYSVFYTGPEYSTITYFNRYAESVLKIKQEEEGKTKAIIERQRNDSLKKVREIEDRIREEENRQKELNHQKSIKQI